MGLEAMLNPGGNIDYQASENPEPDAEVAESSAEPETE